MPAVAKMRWSFMRSECTGARRDEKGIHEAYVILRIHGLEA
jgi:hypothetical protein